MMNPFDSRYFKINRFLLSFVGLWPYQDANRKRFAVSWTVFGVLSFCIPQVLYLLKFLNDIDRVLSALPAIMGGLMMTSKLFSFWYKSIEMRALLDRMSESWGSLSNDNEMEILRKYAENGRRFTLTYITIITVCGVYYFFMPLTGPVLDMILPLNDSRPRVFIHPVEYLIDQQKYYYPLLLNQYLSYIACFISIVGSDVLFIVLVEDICGVLYRLSNIPACNTNNRKTVMANSFREEDGTVYRDAVDCIRLHRTAKQLVQMLQSAFALFFVVEFSLGILMHSTSCVMSIIRMNRPEEFSKYLAMAIVQSLRLFVNSLPGQKLMDYSANISIAAYNGLWYATTGRVKGVLLLLMINNQSPTMLTMGSLYTINLVSFSMVMKTSVSYCTIMGSLHDRQQGS